MEQRFWEQAMYLVKEYPHSNGAYRSRIEFTLFTLSYIANMQYNELVEKAKEMLKSIDK